ncbi:hypothetical protein COMNV_01638 [Commensalibacter sp. Nvir]|uniref:hypothetical protein n=1 Tax=Commensalibacter sp. Nvir TaxID=3069817 RepID=UPI002D3E06C7|nr:hypothetical protein COMNV_01638 [Commensalibacter sp. Nvir]
MNEIIDQKLLNKILNIFKEHIDDEPDEEHGGFYLWKYMDENKKNVRHLLYLVNEGFCKVLYQKSSEGNIYFAAPMKLTNKGIHYLSNIK